MRMGPSQCLVMKLAFRRVAGFYGRVRGRPCRQISLRKSWMERQYQLVRPLDII
jgi:hypothetical protein